MKTQLVPLLAYAYLLEAVHGVSLVQMPDAKRVEGNAEEQFNHLRMRDATSVVMERDDLPILPSPMVVVDPSADYWEGKEFRYDLTDSAGNQEKISVRIFEDEVAPDDPDLLYADTVRMSRRDDTSPSSLFEKRALVCDWVYGCANAATYVAYVSANEIAAAASAFGTFLRANDYKAAKKIQDSAILQLSIAIGAAGGVGAGFWYLGSKMQMPAQVGATDADKCGDDDLERMITHILDNVRQHCKMLNDGSKTDKKWDRYTRETTQNYDGEHLWQTLKTTLQANNYKNLSDC